MFGRLNESPLPIRNVLESWSVPRLLIRCACLFFNVLSGLVNGYDICITTGILDFMDRDLVLCQDEREVSTCFLKDCDGTKFIGLVRNRSPKFCIHTVFE